MTRAIFAKFFISLGVLAILVGGVSFLVGRSLGVEKIKPEIVSASFEKKYAKLPVGKTNEQSRESFESFGTVRITPDLFLDGEGTNIDSPEFFESKNPQDTLLLVSGKGNDTIEIWKFPFENNQLTAIDRKSLPNGLDVDQDKKLLLVGDAEKKVVEIRSLPDFSVLSTVGQDVLESGETNLDTLTFPDGSKHMYVSENRKISVFNLKTGAFIFSFSPNVKSIEEVLADSYHQIIYVPEEKGFKSETHPGGAIMAYHPDGKEYLKNGSNVFGQGLFTGDEEGIALYTCRGSDGKDDGRGFILVANQASAVLNSLELFDRVTWEHLGSLILEGVSGTDGIAVTERPLPNYPQGILAVSNADKNVALISWEKIASITNMKCGD